MNVLRAIRCRRGLLWIGTAIVLALALAGATRANPIGGATYTGTATGGGTVEFTVSADGSAITHFYVDGVTTTCTTLNNTNWNGSTAISGDAFSYAPTSGLRFSGTFSDAQHASGVLSIKLTGGFTCTSADVSWSAATDATPLDPHYTLSVGQSYTIAQGTTSITPIVSVTAVDGWSGSVSFDLAGNDGGSPTSLPAGFSKITGGTYWQSAGDQGVTETPIGIAADQAPGTYELLLLTTDGSLSLNLPLSVTVEAPPEAVAYTLTADGPFSVDPGGTFTPTITLAATGGWAGTATLDLAGRDDSGNPVALPTGFSKGTGGWSPLGPAEQTTTPIDVGADVAAGPYHLLITSDDGNGVTFNLPINVTVGGGGPGPVPVPAYSIVTDPTSATIDAGQSRDVSVSVSADEGFGDTVDVCLFAQHEDHSPGAALPTGITTSPGQLSFASGSYATPQTMTVTAASDASGTFALNFGNCDGSLFAPTFTLTVNAAGAPPDFAFSLDSSEMTAAPGGTVTPTAQITPDEGFSGTIQFSLTPIDGFTAGLWDDLVVGGTNSEELPIQIGADVAAGDYTLELVAHAEALGLTDKTQQLVVHVSATAPQVMAQSEQLTSIAVPADAHTVAHDQVYTADVALDALMINESSSATVHAPQIVADATSPETDWSPPVTLPVTQTGADLEPNPTPHGDVPDASMLALTTFNGLDPTCSGCSTLATSASPHFDAGVSQQQVPAGGGEVTVTVDVTPTDSLTDNLLVAIDTTTGSPGAPTVTGYTLPTLSNGEVQLAGDAYDSLVDWQITNAQVGVTYTLTATISVANGSGSPVDYAPKVVVRGSDWLSVAGTTGTSVSLDAPVLGTGGTLAFSSTDTVDWAGGRLLQSEVKFPAVLSGDGGEAIARAEVNEWAWATLEPGATTVAAGDTFPGDAQWVPIITADSGTVLAPSITASSDAMPAFTTPPSDWPTTASGDDLPAGSMFSMSDLQGGCPGCRDVLTDYDVTVTPATGGDPATIAVTPRTEGEFLQVDVQTIGEGFDFGNVSAATYPELANGETLEYEGFSDQFLTWRIHDASAGHTYELQVTAPGAAGSWQPQVRVYTRVPIPEGEQTATSFAVDNPALGANGTITFSAGNSVVWHGTTYHGNGVMFPATQPPPASVTTEVGESIWATLAPGTTSVSSAESLPGDVSWVAQMILDEGSAAVTSPSITASSDVEPAFSSTPFSWPYTVSGDDLTTPGASLTMSALNGRCPGCGDAVVDYDVDVTPGNGSDTPATVAITPYTDGERLGVELAMSGDGWDLGEMAAVSLPSLTDEDLVYQGMPDGRHLTWIVDGVEAGHTYTIQLSGAAAYGTWAPAISVYTRVAHDDGASNGTSFEVPNPALGENGTFTFASAAPAHWHGTTYRTVAVRLLQIVPEALPDGAGSMDVFPQHAGLAAAGSTLTFTYTADTDGLAGGAVTLTVPSGWTAPTTSPGAAGLVTADLGDVSVSGRTITVSGLTMAGSDQLAITYADATAPGTSGPQTWPAQEKSTAGGTLTDLASSPVVTIVAPDGSGTMTAAPSVFAVGEAGQTITFTYTAAAGGLDEGTVGLTVSDDWPAPSLTPGDQGYTTASPGTLDVVAQTIYVSGLTLSEGQTVTIVYHADAPAYGVSGQWETTEASSVEGTLTDIETFGPTISVVAPDGTGTLETETTMVGKSSTGNTIVFTYTADVGGLADGTVSLTVPPGWSAPSTSQTAPGYITSSDTDVTVGVSGQVATFSHVTLTEGDTLGITYGDNETGATAPAAAGDQTWQAKEMSAPGGTLTSLAASPVITILGPPTISSFADTDQTPNGTTGIVGDTVVIHGTGFSNVTDVAFNGQPVDTFNPDSDTQITTWVPEGATTGKITVTSPGGTATSAGSFTVVVEPVIDSFTPAFGKAGTLVTINGGGFTGVTRATFLSATDVVNGTSLKVVNDTKITVVVPAGAATGPITLFNIAAPDGISSFDDFVVVVKPAIDSFDPPQGIVGDTVTISGSDLLGVTTVKFGAKATAISADQIAADGSSLDVEVPSGATTGKIAVTNVAGTATSVDTFVVIQPPKIAAFMPALAQPGATVTITGTHLLGVDDVAFGDGHTTPVTLTDTKLTAVVPDDGTTGPITVTNAADSFTSVKSFGVILPPQVDSFDPLFGKAGAMVSVTGSGFTGTNLVTFDGPLGPVKAKFKVVSDTLLTVTVPKGTVVESSLGVANPADSATSLDMFTVVLPPAITSLTTDAVGTDDDVVITGTNFYGDSGHDVAVAVKLNGLPAEVSSISDTEIHVTVPAGTTTGKVVVSHPAGKATSKASLIVAGIKSFSPAQAVAGKLVTITGTHLDLATDVSFGGVSTVPVIHTDTKVTAYVPADGITGPITITTSDGLTAVSVKQFGVIKQPHITSFTASAHVGDTVTIEGSGFTGVTSVKFTLNKAAKFTVVSDTLITAKVPLGVAAGTITVANAAGSASAGPFTPA